MHGRRRKQFGFGDRALVERVPDGLFLVRVDKLIDWAPIERMLESLYSHTGRPSHPPLVLFKMLLLEQWFNLSDPQAEAQVKDRLSFMRFVGLGLDDEVPDETTLVRFRQRLASLHTSLLAAINDQLEARGLVVKRGTLIDATVVRSARKAPPARDGSKDTSDKEAGWSAKDPKRPVHGFKAHIAVDAGSTLIRAVEATPAHVHDSRMAEALVQWDEAAVYADKAYDCDGLRGELGRMGIADGILRRKKPGKELCEQDAVHNRRCAAIRAEVERPFAWWKALFGLRRCRYVGLDANRVHFGLLAVAYNLKRGLSLAVA